MNSGITTLLGRGGSDYSAALIAQAINATKLYIWTDVKGIYQVDPSIIKKAQLVKQMSFDEAAELATFGAKVLHPSTLWPASIKNINIIVKSTFFPKISGTSISELNSKKAAIKAIAERKKQLLIIIKSFEMPDSKGFLAGVFTTLSKNNINVDLVSTSEVNIALTLNYSKNEFTKNFLKEDVFKQLEAVGNIEISIEENLSLIAIVGYNIYKTRNINNQLFFALKTFNIRLIHYGASGNNICLLINQAQAKKMIETIFRVFLK